MCRMLAAITERPFSTGYLQDFRRLAEVGRVSSSAKTRGHRDGWGIVQIADQPRDLGHRAFDDDGPVEANAAMSQVFSRVCAEIERERLSGIFLVHVRKASSGQRVRENTAPFIDGGWVFSHNGTVEGLGSGEVSDSRVLFGMLVGEIAERGDVVEGLRVIVKKIRAEYTYSSMTFLLSDNRDLYAYRDHTRDNDYYALRYAFAEDSTLIFTQEEIWSLDWSAVPNRSLVITHRDLTTEGPFKI